MNVDFADLPESKQGPLDARSGVNIKISFSFQYELVKESLPKLYMAHNVRYEREFILTAAEGKVKEVATQYNVSDYWAKRTEVGERMRTALDAAFVSNATVGKEKLQFAKCVGF